MILDLIHNVALLVTLAVGSEMLARRGRPRSRLFGVLMGGLFGAAGIVGMMTPMHFAPGVIYDARSIVLSLAGLFGGPVAAGISAIMCAVYRAHLGGGGALAGVATVVESAALGTILYYLRRRSEAWVSPIRLWAFGLLVHVGMLALQLLVPGMGLQILRRIGPSVLIFFPLGFVVSAQVFLLGERRRNAERALSRSQDRYRTLAEDMPALICRFLPDGEITYANRACADYFATSPEALTGTSFFRLVEEDRRESVMADIRALTVALPTNSHEHRAPEPGGALRWLRWTNRALFDASGRAVAYQAIGEDITERKRAEAEREKLQAQLVQAQKMESVGRLAGGVAHDFNNMLSVIQGHAQLALGDMPEDSRLHAGLEEILKAAERSANLTRQLLAFARKQTVSPRILDLNETVASMLQMLGRLIGEDIELLWAPGPGLAPVRIDPGQVDQLLANLCVNARYAIGPGVGKVTIETSAAAFDADYCAAHAGFVVGEYVMLAVSDDGCGMDEETRAKVFEPFFTTKGVGEGTGLGLATVYGIVKQNDGFVTVYSEPGAGAAFRIYLPAHKAATPQAPAARDDAACAVPGHGTILLVEDEPSILNLTRTMLERLGYTVLAAATPGEAIRRAEAHSGRIDLLLTDVVMPEMNGRDLANKLLTLYPDLQILFMSGYTANVVAHHGVLDPGVHFVQKPFSLKDLAAKVRESLDRR